MIIEWATPFKNSIRLKTLIGSILIRHFSISILQFLNGVDRMMQIMALKGRETTEPINLNKETEGSSSNRSENSSDINLDISRTSAIDSPLATHPNRPLFPSSLRPTPATHHLLQNSTRPELQCPKIEHPVQEESFCNMFIGMDDHSGLWPWSEHHNFH